MSLSIPTRADEIRFIQTCSSRIQLGKEIDRRLRDRLGSSRVALGLSHRDVARRAGTYANFVKGIEQGRCMKSSGMPDLFERACTEGGLEGVVFSLSRAVWLPLSDLRLCRTIRPVRVDPSWLTNVNGAALSLARSIRENRSFDRLPELGQVLKAAGCVEGSILDHCREPGLHASGCWVVDALVRAGRAG